MHFFMANFYTALLEHRFVFNSWYSLIQTVIVHNIFFVFPRLLVSQASKLYKIRSKVLPILILCLRLAKALLTWRRFARQVENWLKGEGQAFDLRVMRISPRLAE